MEKPLVAGRNKSLLGPGIWNGRWPFTLHCLHGRTYQRTRFFKVTLLSGSITTLFPGLLLPQWLVLPTGEKNKFVRYGRMTWWQWGFRR